MTLRIDVSATAVGAIRAPFVTAIGALGFADACSTSRFTMRPLGPVPATAARSTPDSAAIFLASGDARTRPFVGSGGGAGAATGFAAAGSGGGADAAGAGAAGAGAGGATSSIFSPGFPMYATGDPTGAA